jgi:hypothetical protein
VFVPKLDNTGKSQRSSYEPPSRMPSAGGEYTQWALVLNTIVAFYFD